MRNLIVLFALSCALLALVGFSLADDQQEIGQNNDSPRKSFHVPKVFDFNSFAKRFQKLYANSVEYLIRQKVFLATAMRAYISAIKYKLRRSTHFNSINQMSDWTREERDAIYMKPGLAFRPSDDTETVATQQVEQQPLTTPEPLEALEEEQVIQVLDEMASRRDESEIFEAVAQQVESAATTGAKSSRRKRSADDTRPREVAIEDLLIRSDSEPAESVKETTRDQLARFKNPDYIQPEVTSFGDSEKNMMPSIVQSLKLRVSNGVSKIHDIFADTSATLSSGTYKADYIMRISDEERAREPDKIYVDHRQSNCFMPIKSQGTCGSCYIFAVLALFEYGYCKQTGKNVAFSEQYVLDCGAARKGMGGCEGGYPEQVSDFTNEYGLELNRNYPYHKVMFECPYDAKVPKKSMGYLRVNNANLRRVRPSKVNNRLMETPLEIVIMTSEDFSDYGGGVHNPGRRCRSDHLHAMVAVGMGREDGIDYYLIRNSYSWFWGEVGYYKLAASSRKHCVIEDYWSELSALQSNLPLVKSENKLYESRLAREKIPEKSEIISYSDFDSDSDSDDDD